MPEDLDSVSRYSSALGFQVRPRTVLVEGTTDVDLFHLAARLEREETGDDLLGASVTIVCPGSGDLGGTRGVIRELLGLRAIARTCLLPSGRPRYRFIALFDTDQAGRQAVRAAQDIDTSLLEYKDMFRLHPVMPMPTALDPKSLRAAFESANAGYRGIEWEAEDLLPGSFVEAFLLDSPGAVRRTIDLGNGTTHRDFTKDGKARFHRFVRENALRADLKAVVDVLKALRHYFGLPATSEANTQRPLRGS